MHNQHIYTLSVEFLHKNYTKGQTIACCCGEQFEIIDRLFTPTFDEVLLRKLRQEDRIRPGFLAARLNVKPRPANNLSN
jgi:hypothetical protein